MFNNIVNRVLLIFVNNLAIVFQRMGLRSALFLGTTLGTIAFFLFPSRRRTTFKNLRMALGNQTAENKIREIAFRMSQNLGRYAVEFLRLPRLTSHNIDSYVKITGLDNLKSAFALKHGVIVLTAHFGNWDLLATTVVLKGFPVNLITKYLSVAAFNDFWLECRGRMGIKQLYREGSLREIIQCLRNNEIIGFVLDQNARRNEGIFVDFFGIPACTIPAVAVLAQRFDLPVVPAFIIRQKNGTHKAIFEKPLSFEAKSTLEQSIVHNTQIYTNILEKYIRLYPDHWTWLHHRWKTRPEGAPPIYEPKTQKKKQTN